MSPHFGSSQAVDRGGGDRGWRAKLGRPPPPNADSSVIVIVAADADAASGFIAPQSHVSGAKRLSGV